MTKFYKKIFSGFLLVLLDINIGRFDILSDPLGYLVIFLALVGLYKKDQMNELLLASGFTVVLFIESVYAIVRGPSPNGIYLNVYAYLVMILSWLASTGLGIVIYFVSLKYVQEYDINDRVRREGNQFALINGLLVLVLSTIMVIPLEWMTGMVTITAIIGFILHVRFLFTVNHLKKLWLSLEEPSTL